MLKHVKNKKIYFRFKNKHNKNVAAFSTYPLSKASKGLSLIPKNTGGRVFCV